MIFEVAGARLVAPYLGSSTYVWTSIIGVVLGALSLGYWLGGIKADKDPTSILLARILLLAGILIFVSYSLSEFTLTLFNAYSSYILASFFSSLILFAPASVLLGMISPLVVKLKMNDIAHSGQTVGNLYAISTLGSIVGTFLAGYLLIPLYGTSAILISLSATLITLAIFANVSVLDFKINFKNFLFLFLFLLLSLLLMFKNDSELIADFDTSYSHIKIYNTTDLKGFGIDDEKERELQILQMNAVSHSGMYTDDANELAFPYSNYFRLAEHFAPDFKNTLLLGGGAFSLPKFFLGHYPSSTIDVVEIDPVVTDIAFDYFELKNNERMKIFNQDARMFINQTHKKYDVIYGDVFSSYLSIPFHLTTQEATKSIARILNDDGIYIVNVIGSIEGRSSGFVKAYIATLNTVFSNTYIFPIDSKDAEKFQNIIIVADKRTGRDNLTTKKEYLAELLSHNWRQPIALSENILTDNHAPVEYYLKEALHR